MDSRLRHALGFLVAGGLAFLADAAVLEGLSRLTPLSPLACRLVSIALAMVVSWRLQRWLTFGRRDRGSLAEFAAFAGVAWMGAAVNYASFALILWALPLPVLAAMTLSSVIAMAWSYLGFRFWVFRR